MANYGLELPGEVVVNDQADDRHLYTILGWPRSIIISRDSISNRPFYSPWSNFTCKLCTSEELHQMEDLQSHMAEEHDIDIRGEIRLRKLKVQGTNRVKVYVEPYNKNDQQLNSQLGYNLSKYTTHNDHNHKPLFIRIKGVPYFDYPGAACLICQKSENILHTYNYLPTHMKKQHGIEIKGQVWKHLVDETGNNILDTRMNFDPVCFPAKQIPSTADREINHTEEGFIKAFNENDILLYSIEPYYKPKLNKSNEYFYTEDTLYACHLCQCSDSIFRPRLPLNDLKQHMRSAHKISLIHPYVRQPGKITFKLTKVLARVDEIFDEYKSKLYCDQNRIPVSYRKLPPVLKNVSWYCLRCGHKYYRGCKSTTMFKHLEEKHKLSLKKEDKFCYLNEVGDLVYYLVDTSPPPPAETSRMGVTATRPALDPNSNLVGLDTASNTTQSTSLGDPNANTVRLDPGSYGNPSGVSPTRIPLHMLHEDTQKDLATLFGRPTHGTKDAPYKRHATEPAANTPNITKRPRISTNVTSANSTQGIPFVDPIANSIGLHPAANTLITAKICPSCPGNCQCSRPPGTTPSSSDIRTSERTTIWRPRSTTRSETMPNPQSSVASTESYCPACNFYIERCPVCKVKQPSVDCPVCPIVIEKCTKCGTKLRSHMTRDHPGIQPTPVASSSQNLVTSAPVTPPSQSSVIQVDSSSEDELCQEYVHGVWCEHSAPVTSPSQSSVIQVDSSSEDELCQQDVHGV